MYLCRDATGKFPDYPDIDEGGSEVIFKKKEPEVGINNKKTFPYILILVSNHFMHPRIVSLGPDCNNREFGSNLVCLFREQKMKR